MRRVKVTVEVELDVVDPASLERAALAAVDAAEFTGGETERTDERAWVTSGPAAAVGWLVDPFLLAEGLTGVEATDATSFAVALDDAAGSVAPTPDFLALFPVCSCGRTSAPRAPRSN